MTADIRNLPPNKQGTTPPALHPTAEAVNTPLQPGDQILTQEQGTVADQTTPPMAAQELVTEMLTELAEEGYTEKDAFAILDSLLTTGEYHFDFTLVGKISGVFRVRPDWVQQHAVRALETQAPKTVARLTDLINRYNLAGALVEFGRNKFVLDSAADLEKTLSFLEKQPFPIVNMLLNKLVIFDKLVAVAASPWALENFTEPQPEK